MTVPVPYALPVTSSWQLVDWIDKTFTGTADSTGVALISLDRLPDNERWQLTHMVAGAATAAIAPPMRLYLDNVSNGQLRDGTASGKFDVADWPMGLMVPPSTSLLARWTGLASGDQVFLTLQANVLRRSS
jgi:hypothetical protein